MVDVKANLKITMMRNKKMEDTRAYAFMVTAVIFVIVGGCGLDSDNLFLPIVFIVAGMACGIFAMALEGCCNGQY